MKNLLSPLCLVIPLLSLVGCASGPYAGNGLASLSSHAAAPVRHHAQDLVEGMTIETDYLAQEIEHGLNQLRAAPISHPAQPIYPAMTQNYPGALR